MTTLKQRLVEIANDLGKFDPIPNTYFQELLGLSSGRITQLFELGSVAKLGAGAIGRLTKYGYSADWIQTGKKPKKIPGMADLLPSSNTNAITNLEQSAPQAANVSPFANRRSEDHPAIAAVVKLMMEMDDVGKGRLLERATVIAEQHAKANPAKLSQ